MQVRAGAREGFSSGVGAELLSQLAATRRVSSSAQRKVRRARNVLCVLVHDDGHGVHVEAVGLGHHAFTEAVGDVVGAEEAANDDGDLEGDEAKDDDVPSLEDGLFKAYVGALAAGEDAAGVTGLRDGGLDEGREVAAAPELVLDAEPAGDAKVLRPLGVDLAVEVESVLFIGDVAGDDEEGEAEPEEEGVDGEEGAVVEEDACPANEGGDDTEGSGEGGGDELGAVADADDVCVFPDVEPGAEEEDEARDGVGGELEDRKRRG